MWDAVSQEALSNAHLWSLYEGGFFWGQGRARVPKGLVEKGEGVCNKGIHLERSELILAGGGCAEPCRAYGILIQ